MVDLNSARAPQMIPTVLQFWNDIRVEIPVESLLRCDGSLQSLLIYSASGLGCSRRCPRCLTLRKQKRCHANECKNDQDQGAVSH